MGVSMSIWKARRESRNWAEVQWTEIQIGNGEVDIDELEWDAWESMTVRLGDGRIFCSTDQGESWQLFMTRKERLRLWWSNTWLSLRLIVGRVRL